MIQDNDQTESLQGSVHAAIKTEIPLQIVGGASKLFLGRQPQGNKVEINSHQGIVNYHPSELVITARTGTLLSDIEMILADQKQILAFEPPHFSASTTLGGCIASGLSGPRRPFMGSVRDYVLGCKIIDGQANVLSFGGEVMKNVAGYDVSRLMVGAMGTLGLLLEVSLKVLPRPEIEQTQIFELNTLSALAQMTALSQKALPVSGLCFDGQFLAVRLSGVEKAVTAAVNKVGGDLSDSHEFWKKCNQQQVDFFQNCSELWRLSVPPASPEIPLSGDWFYEWGGAQRWLKTTQSKQSIFSLAEQMKGHATLFKTKQRSREIFQPLPVVLKKLNKNIKMAFDPKAIFNPFRMYRDW